VGSWATERATDSSSNTALEQRKAAEKNAGGRSQPLPAALATTPSWTKRHKQQVTPPHDRTCAAAAAAAPGAARQSLLQ
jgi:hypothetical protein